MASSGRHTPNTTLRRLREERGWSLQRVADELRLLAEAEDENRIPGVNANMVGVWERGWKRPSPFYQAIFCQLYHRSASQLGFVSQEALPPVLKNTQQEATSAVPTNSSIPHLALAHEQTRAIDLLCYTSEPTPEQQAGAWLTLGTSGLGQLFNEGWTIDEVLASVQMVLQSLQAMPAINRRQLLQLSGAAILSSIPLPTGERVSEEERMRFTTALGESIGAGWKLFVSASMPQVLAIGQTQLQFLHYTCADIYPDVRPLLYSPVYRLIGATLFFQSRYKEALQAHNHAYITALEAGDSWNMAESLSWQAGVFKACGKHVESMQMTRAALRLLNDSHEAHVVVSKARLLAHWAESAALLGERPVMEEKLAASAELLAQFGENDEFDATLWQLYQGTCALYSGNFSCAEQFLEHALHELKPNLLHQRASATLLQAQARLKLGNLASSLNSVRDAVPLVLATASSLLDRGLIDLIEQLVITLPRDDEVRELVEVVRQHPRLHIIQTQQCVPRYLEATF
ncbi:MAG: hypothetical protein ABI406_09280 [Ktedonobacteraceae bacterium]